MQKQKKPGKASKFPKRYWSKLNCVIFLIKDNEDYRLPFFQIWHQFSCCHFDRHYEKQHSNRQNVRKYFARNIRIVKTFENILRGKCFFTKTKTQTEKVSLIFWSNFPNSGNLDPVTEKFLIFVTFRSFQRLTLKIYNKNSLINLGSYYRVYYLLGIYWIFGGFWFCLLFLRYGGKWSIWSLLRGP